ncbi:NERD domain-containing protein [Salicibibacter cibi]|uniref:NERD domain-containing protein n=1 Tax=Salicibibacter cibi TaxID=2743001 RepID=A0A7T6Z8L7_9BACI|nr:nuclease-related domain-containing protein [Salicibibacter cibi]QQK78945.1 NERD domain-containing protein [Salicibibacter cibi]
MNIIKSREEPPELKVFRLLKPRKELVDQQYYLNLEKGFAGERRMDAWLEEGLSAECLVLNDLLLEHNRKLFQIDTLLIFQEKMHLFDSKNNEGDLCIKSDNWYTLPGTEVTNPLPQLRRAESLLRQLLQHHRMSFPIESTLIFPNPQFMLYNAPPQLPAAFPPQLQRFMKKLNHTPSKLLHKHEILAEKLLSLHLPVSPNARFPEYDYDQLKKGVVCVRCAAIMSHQGKTFYCDHCAYVEKVETGVIRNVEEYKFLFPERKVTNQAMYEWCGMQGDRKTVIRVLTKHFKLVRNGRYSYYID